MSRSALGVNGNAINKICLYIKKQKTPRMERRFWLVVVRAAFVDVAREFQATNQNRSNRRVSFKVTPPVALKNDERATYEKLAFILVRQKIPKIAQRSSFFCLCVVIESDVNFLRRRKRHERDSKGMVVFKTMARTLSCFHLITSRVRRWERRERVVWESW